MIRKRDSAWLVGLGVLLIGFGMLTRFIPHPANFTAVGATALFAGALFPRKWGVMIPLLIMIVTDIFLGLHQLILFTWGSMAISCAIGYLIRHKLNPSRVVIAATIASTQFFLITNWAVWKFGVLYSPSISGLWQSYIAGLPFWRNMLLGDIIFSGVLFGAYVLARQSVAEKGAGYAGYNSKF